MAMRNLRLAARGALQNANQTTCRVRRSVAERFGVLGTQQAEGDGGTCDLGHRRFGHGWQVVRVGVASQDRVAVLFTASYLALLTVRMQREQSYQDNKVRHQLA
jgi:hypothetical protein